jgi:hypothetical protein
MKNVTPKVNQKWISKKGEKATVFKSVNSCVLYEYGGDPLIYTSSMYVFLNDFKFIPQNDLEWLACKVSEWNGHQYVGIQDDTLLKKLGSSNWSFTSEGYTRQQWQNMRYELALDERPHVEYETDEAKIREMMNGRPGTMTFTPIKETKMIDLSKAKVGDRFVLKGDQVVSLIKRNETQLMLEDEEGFYLNRVRDGRSTENNEFDIVSKHDPRPWLSELPDADLFDDDIILYNTDRDDWGFSKMHIACGVDYWKGGLTILSGIKMPKLTGDQWKDSKISIAELRVWQKVNEQGK